MENQHSRITKEADQLVALAEKKKASRKFLFVFPKHSSVYEAVDLYERAGMKYKYIKEWVKAAKAYEEAAVCCLEEKNFYFAAVNYATAGNMHVSSKKAIETHTHAAHAYSEAKYILNSAKQWLEVSRLHQRESDTKSAINAHQKAIHLLRVDHSFSFLFAIEEELADLLVVEGKWSEAGKKFQELLERDEASGNKIKFLCAKANVCFLCSKEKLIQDAQGLYQSTLFAKYIQVAFARTCAHELTRSQKCQLGNKNSP